MPQEAADLGKAASHAGPRFRQPDWAHRSPIFSVTVGYGGIEQGFGFLKAQFG